MYFRYISQNELYCLMGRLVMHYISFNKLDDDFGLNPDGGAQIGTRLPA